MIGVSEFDGIVPNKSGDIAFQTICKSDKYSIRCAMIPKSRCFVFGQGQKLVLSKSLRSHVNYPIGIIRRIHWTVIYLHTYA